MLRDEDRARPGEAGARPFTAESAWEGWMKELEKDTEDKEKDEEA